MPRHCKFREGQTRIFMMETIIPSEAGYLIVSIPHFVRDDRGKVNYWEKTQQSKIPHFTKKKETELIKRVERISKRKRNNPANPANP